MIICFFSNWTLHWPEFSVFKSKDYRFWVINFSLFLRLIHWKVHWYWNKTKQIFSLHLCSKKFCFNKVWCSFYSEQCILCVQEVSRYIKIDKSSWASSTTSTCYILSIEKVNQCYWQSKRNCSRPQSTWND